MRSKRASARCFQLSSDERITIMSGNDVGAVRRLINATRNSLQELRHAWANEAAFRYEVYVLILALPTAWWIGRSAVERALLIGSVLLVLIVELVNSAVEAVVDRVGLEHHVLSGRAKDLASAAVFGAIIAAATVWLTLLFG